MQYPKPPAFHLAQSTITPALFSRQSKPHLAFHTAGSCQNIIVIIEKKNPQIYRVAVKADISEKEK